MVQMHLKKKATEKDLAMFDQLCFIILLQQHANEKWNIS